MENITFLGVNIFGEESHLVLAKIMTADPNPMHYLGFIVFLKVGITLTGFHDEDISQRALTLFERGAWDHRISKMQPFSL